MNHNTKTIYYRLGRSGWGWRILDKLGDGLLAKGQAYKKRDAELAAKAKHKELRKSHEQNDHRN